MITIELNKEEAHILWAILNNAQSQGLFNVGNLLKLTNESIYTEDLMRDWIKQTSQEYDVINKIKCQLG